MNHGINTEPEFLTDFNLQHVNQLMNFYHVQKMYRPISGKFLLFRLFF